MPCSRRRLASSQMKWNEVPIHMMPTMTWAQRKARLIQSATIGSMAIPLIGIPSIWEKG